MQASTLSALQPATMPAMACGTRSQDGLVKLCLKHLNISMLNKNGNNIAFAWAPVTKGAHGGYVDTSKLTYEVTCLPEGKVVSTGSNNVYYLDSYNSDSMIVRYYSVKAVVDTFISESSVSDKLVLGKYCLSALSELIQ
jgi:hypothetical protein